MKVNRKCYLIFSLIVVTFLLGACAKQEILSEETKSMENKWLAAENPTSGNVVEDFTILEIVPHDCCSLFPYLVGGLEAQTPIGEEGLMISSGMTSSIQMFQEEESKDANLLRPYSRIKDKYKEVNLHRYLNQEYKTYASLVTTSVNDIQAGTKWHIINATDEKTNQEINYQNESGYFEYVGEGGLYKIDTSLVDGFEYTYQKDESGSIGFKGIDHVVQERNHGENYSDTGSDFDIIFSSKKADFVKFINTSKAFYFQNTTPEQNMYKVKGNPIPNESGKYYKDSSGKFIYDPQQTKKLRDSNTIFYDVVFERTWQEKDVYYISNITVADELGRGSYYLKCYSKYQDVGEGNGVLEKFIANIKPYAITGGKDDLANQKWIWVSSTEPLETTNPLATVNDVLHPQLGTKIYLTDVSMKKWMYARDGYVNNEWFKILCLNWEEFDYDFNKTAVENVNRAREIGLLDDYNIKVITKKPGDVTQQDIAAADMVYISDVEGIEGLGIEDNWKAVTRKEAIEPIPDGFGSMDLKDFSLVYKIYYEYSVRNKAVIMNVRTNSLPHTSNLYKLHVMFNTFENPDAFSYFYDTLNRPEINFQLDGTTLYGNYCRIEPNGNVLFANYNQSSTTMNPICADGSICSTFTLGARSGWEPRYFYPYKILQNPDGTLQFNENDNELIKPDIFKARHDNFQDIDKYIGVPFMNIHWYAVGFFKSMANMENIYLLLQGIGAPNISFPNAELTAGEEAVMYVDDLQDIFYVDYRVTSKRKNVNKITIDFEDIIGANYIGNGSFRTIKSFSVNPEDKRYEQNHLLGTNTEMIFGPVDSAGYQCIHTSEVFFPRLLSTGMRRKVRVIVNYSKVAGSNHVIEAEIYRDIDVIVRDSFDLN